MATFADRSSRVITEVHLRWVQCSAHVSPYLPARRTRSPPVLQSGQTEHAQAQSSFEKGYLFQLLEVLPLFPKQREKQINAAAVCGVSQCPCNTDKNQGWCWCLVPHPGGFKPLPMGTGQA